MPRQKIANCTVADVCPPLTDPPAAVRDSDLLEDLLQVMRVETGMRHVYVTDANGRLTGSINVQKIVAFLFPTAAAMRSQQGLYGGIMEQYDTICAREVKDLCDRNPLCVQDSTLLTEVARIFLQEKITELPVVDADGLLVGEVNMYEIIDAYVGLCHKEVSSGVLT